jgi:hypothetical protein
MRATASSAHRHLLTGLNNDFFNSIRPKRSSKGKHRATCSMGEKVSFGREADLGARWHSPLLVPEADIGGGSHDMQADPDNRHLP